MGSNRARASRVSGTAFSVLVSVVVHRLLDRWSDHSEAGYRMPAPAVQRGLLAGCADGEDLAAVLDVDPELVLERVDRVEPHLAPEPGRDAHPGLLAVEVTVEVDEVGLDQEEAVLLVERRASPDVDRRRVRDRVIDGV